MAMIIHPLHGYGICYALWSRSVFLDSAAPLEYAMLVECHGCRRTGVIPDEGHELEFLPPGTAVSEDGKSFIFRSAASYPEVFPSD
jgi:hypothetical protein